MLPYGVPEGCSAQTVAAAMETRPRRRSRSFEPPPTHPQQQPLLSHRSISAQRPARASLSNPTRSWAPPISARSSYTPRVEPCRSYYPPAPLAAKGPPAQPASEPVARGSHRSPPGALAGSLLASEAQLRGLQSPRRGAQDPGLLASSGPTLLQSRGPQHWVRDPRRSLFGK